MTLTIRPYRATDCRAAWKVFFRAVREGTVAFHTEAERDVLAPSDLPDYNTPDKLLEQWAWVAEEAGKMQRFMSLCHDGELDMAFVLPEVMGKGVAAALYEALQTQAEAADLVWLNVRAAQLSRRFMQRRGWQMDGIERMEDGGQVYELNLLSLTLEPQAARKVDTVCAVVNEVWRKPHLPIFARNRSATEWLLRQPADL
jgi:putative acetyltransferase